MTAASSSCGTLRRAIGSSCDEITEDDQSPALTHEDTETRHNGTPCDINIAMSRKLTVQLPLAFLVLIVLTVPLPAFAYGDPSGGLLFQTLTPLMAILWGAWMIFANSVRKGVRKAMLRIRGVAVEEAVADDTEKAVDAD